VSRGRIAAALVAAVATFAGIVSASGAAPNGGKPPHIKNVFIIVLENENADTTFGPKSEAPYLSKTLRRKGEYLANYYATGHLSLDNYISMVSGLAPNPQTQADCMVYSDFLPGVPAANGQFVGTGCVYPPGVQTVANQLEGAGYAWKGYMQDMNAGTPTGQPEVTCRHPAINTRDDTQSAHKGDQYAARHNPFVYFHSIIDFKTCEENDVDLTHLRTDLKKERKTPNYSFITPNLCFDGHDEPCVNGKPGGLKSANVFLKKWVPRIRRSPAFRHHGLLVVTFDEAVAYGSGADSSACCNEQPGPNLVPPVTPGGLTPGPGGGKVGAVLLSPCLKPGTVTKTAYNHYALLRTVEANFGLPYLGYAGQSGLSTFDSKVLNRPGCKGH
jgi:phosphatidylinositol-3-phosphatase